MTPSFLLAGLTAVLLGGLAAVLAAENHGRAGMDVVGVLIGGFWVGLGVVFLIVGVVA